MAVIALITVITTKVFKKFAELLCNGKKGYKEIKIISQIIEKQWKFTKYFKNQ